MSSYDDRLYDIQKWLADKVGASPSLDFAEKYPESVGIKDQPGGGGYEDALRHVVGAGELTRTRGNILARTITGGHEFINKYLQKEYPGDLSMDAHNNEIGHEIGRTAKSREDVVNRAQAAYTSGQLKTYMPGQSARSRDLSGSQRERLMQLATPEGAWRVRGDGPDLNYRHDSTDAPTVSPSLLDKIASATAPYRKTSTEVADFIKSNTAQRAVGELAQGMATGTGPGGAMSGIVRSGLNASDAIVMQRLSPRETELHYDGATHRFWDGENMKPEMDGRRHGIRGWVNENKKIAYLEIIDVDPKYRGRGVGDEGALALVTKLDEQGIRTLNLNSLPGKEDFYIRMGGKPNPFGEFHGMNEFNLNVKDVRRVLEGKKLTEKYPNPMRTPQTPEEIEATAKAFEAKHNARIAAEKGKK